MSIPAISLPAEDLYLLTDLGVSRLRHPRLPDLTAAGLRGYLALHAASTPPDPARLTDRARWLGWCATSGMATPRGRACRPVLILRPEARRVRQQAARSGRNLRVVDLLSLPRGAVVAMAEVVGERPGGLNQTPEWYLRNLTVLAQPVPVETDGWPVYTPWSLLPPADDVVRQQWVAARRGRKTRREKSA